MLPLRNSKRINLPRAFQYDKLFIKDWDRLSRSGRYDMRRLHEAMILLVSNEAPLGAEWKDHALKRRMARLSGMPYWRRFSVNL